MRVLLVAAVIAVAATAAQADEPFLYEHQATPERCAATFRDRLASMRETLVGYEQHNREHERLIPWFNEHCRFLTDLEIAIRKLDDENSFVCDTQKGRPKGLTSTAVIDHMSRALPVDDYVWVNRACEAADIRTFGVSLSFDLPDTRWSSTKEWTGEPYVKLVHVLCFEHDTKACAELRAKVDGLSEPRAPEAAAPVHGLVREFPEPPPRHALVREFPEPATPSASAPRPPPPPAPSQAPPPSR